MKKAVWVAVFLSVLLSSACGTIGCRVQGNYQLDKSSHKGLVVVSTRLVDQCGKVGGLHAKIFKEKEAGWGTDLMVKNFLIKPDIGNDGYFAVYEFDEGAYTIGNVSVTGFTLVARSTPDPDMLGFSVEAGSVTYIGEIAFTVAQGCGQLMAQVSNEWKRDAELFKARMKNIAPSIVKIGLATVPKNR